MHQLEDTTKIIINIIIIVKIRHYNNYKRYKHHTTSTLQNNITPLVVCDGRLLISDI